MQHGAASWRGSWPWALSWPGAALAADAAAGPAGAAWTFVTVALLVAAAASYAAGYYRARSRQAPPQAARVAAASAPAAAATGVRHLAARLADDARPVLLLGAADGAGERTLVAANAAALRILGAQADALGRPWSDAGAGAPATLRTLLGDAASAGAEGWWLLRDDARGELLVLGSSDDAAAEAAALGYTVSHDLRAPIRVVEGFTRIVKEDYGRLLDRVGNDHLDRVLAAAARMNLMIDAMLTQARLATQPLTRQPVDLSQIAAYVVDELRRQQPERSTEVVIEPGLAARGDPTLLRLVLENLLGNAWKYSGQCAAPRIEFAATVQDGRSGYVVRDNGAGFDMRLADRLFGLFQRLHSAKDFPGTGVGLASVKRIVQRHGGEIWARSEPGQGAAFYFTLR